jgi:hypothetical protein
MDFMFSNIDLFVSVDFSYADVRFQQCFAGQRDTAFRGLAKQ